MKLLFCPECLDVFKLQFRDRSCSCGVSRGHYEKDGERVTVRGGLVMGLGNRSLLLGLQSVAHMGDLAERGPDLSCWFFPPGYDKVRRE